MKKLFFNSLIVGVLLATLPLQASNNKRGYELIKNEDAFEKRTARQYINSDFENKENSTPHVPAVLHPGFEQYMLYCEKKGISCNLELLKKNLMPLLGNSSLFLEWATSRYNVPPPFISSLYEALQAEVNAYSSPKKTPSSPINLLKKIRGASSEKRQGLRTKIKLVYSREQEKLSTELLLARRIANQQETMKLTYKHAKLDYYYALTFDNHSEERNILLRKAYEEFCTVKQFKEEKIKQYQDEIIGFLQG
jgi:hypothetical protein